MGGIVSPQTQASFFGWQYTVRIITHHFWERLVLTMTPLERTTGRSACGTFLDCALCSYDPCFADFSLYPFIKGNCNCEGNNFKLVL